MDDSMSSNFTAEPPRHPDARVEKERRQQIEQLMDKLDARDASDPQRKGRKTIRAQFRRFDVPVWVHHPGGSANQRFCVTRDLSSTGAGVLLDGFLHSGTRVNLKLNRYVGGTDSIRGKVIYCSHVGGNWHSVGLRLDRKIFPKLYLDPDQAGGVELEVRDPATVSGKVLYCDGSELDTELVAHMLRDTKVKLSKVSTIAETEDKIRKVGETGFDLVLIDLNFSSSEQGMKGAELLEKLRAAGHDGPIGVLTADPTGHFTRDVQAQGVANLLAKPFDQDKLIAAVGDWVACGHSSGEEAIYSQFAADEAMQPLLQKFVKSARQMAMELASLIAKGDYEETSRMCLTLRGTGGGYGYPAVTEAAAEALKSLEATMSAEESVVPLQHLQDACKRLAAGDPMAF